MAHLVVRPMEIYEEHIAESWALFILTLISIMASPQLAHIQFASREPIENEQVPLTPSLQAVTPCVSTGSRVVPGAAGHSPDGGLRHFHRI